MAVLPNNKPRYIEEFIRSGPDAFNGNSPTGDPASVDPVNGDWLPTVNRAVTLGLGLASSLPAQRNVPVTVLFGNTQDSYNFSDTVHAFANIIGLYPGVRFNFTDAPVGIAVHYPDTGPGLGTFHPANGYALAPGMAPFEGYGIQKVRIENIVVSFPGFNVRNVINGTAVPPAASEGTRGIVIHSRAYIKHCDVFYAGWHGFHISADVLRDFISNANSSTLTNCLAYGNGYNPGNDASLAFTENPNGFRGYGCGYCFEGGDANIIRTSGIDATWNAYADILDFGFLGNYHEMPHVAPIGRDLTALEVDAYTAAAAVPGASRTPAQANAVRYMNPFGQPAGTRDAFAIILGNVSARTVLDGPYVEGMENPGSPVRSALVFGQGNCVTAAGIGGRQEGPMTRYGGTVLSSRGLQVVPTRDFNLTPWGGSEDSGIQTRMTVGANGNIGELLGYYLQGVPSQGDIVRTKYVPHLDESSPSTVPGTAGSYRTDFANLDGRIISLIGRNSLILAGREIENGRAVIPQAFYLGALRVNITNTDPRTVTPSSAGSVRLHGNGPGDRPGDLAVWHRADFSTGEPWLFQCVGTVGSGATWEPLLSVP